jgi:hypothetical protein
MGKTRKTLSDFDKNLLIPLSNKVKNLALHESRRWPVENGPNLGSSETGHFRDGLFSSDPSFMQPFDGVVGTSDHRSHGSSIDGA